MKPTIVLVHGAFAESATCNRVIQRLHADGCPVISNVTAATSTGWGG
ncbi:hypothetical protein [Micromonospora sp. B9E7]